LAGKTLGLVGVGRIGKETIKRALAMGMKPIAYGNYWDDEFAMQYGVERKNTVEELLKESDVVSLHTHVSEKTRGMINKKTIALMKDKALLINTGRGALIVEQDVADACKSGKLWGYASDVLEFEPMRSPHSVGTPALPSGAAERWTPGSRWLKERQRRSRWSLPMANR